MKEDKIKEAFTKAKQDILSLYSELHSIKQEIKDIKHILNRQTDKQTDTSTHFTTENPAQTSKNTTIQHINPTYDTFPTHNPAQDYTLKALKTQKSNISTGNGGVPADRQTNKQTDTSTGNQGVKLRLIDKIAHNTDKISNLQKVSEVINSLDDIKKELRHKIKRLTNQEMIVFSCIYQFEEEGFSVEYNLLAQRLNLTESSIRDYIQRIIKKGLPLLKTKINNKKIVLSVSQNLKKIASLSTIVQLREL